MGYTTDFEGEFHCYRPENEHLAVFLRAILEGDHAAKVPLADWLIDHNDPRGEEIARLAKHPSAGPREFWRSFGLEPAHAAYLHAFSDTRRMRRDASRAALFPDPIREAVGLPIGPEGAYFVGGRDDFGQGEDESILDYNDPPYGQPGLWCQWIPSKDRTAIVWSGAEKFYYYVEWLEYLIEHFLGPWGYLLNGEVDWQGEEEEDRGTITVVENAVKAARR